MYQPQDFIQQFHELRSSRLSLDKVYEDISTYVHPYGTSFLHGQKRTQEVYDSTAIMACRSLTAALWSMVSPLSARWFSIDVEGRSSAYKAWVYKAEQTLLQYIHHEESIFYSRLYEFYGDLVAYGTAIFFVGENTAENRLYHATRSLQSCYCTQNAYESLDRVYRQFNLSADTASSLFPTSMLSNKKTFSLLHVVLPSSSPDAFGRRYRSYYVDMDSASILLTGWYYSMPYQVARFRSMTGQFYGESPSMVALPDIKTLNAITKTLLISAQKSVDPPLLTTDAYHSEGIRTAPGGIIYGGLDPISGNRRFEPLISGGDVSFALRMQEQKRTAIEQAFLSPLISFVMRSNATATEVLAQRESHLALLSPIIGRLHHEFLQPLLARQLSLLVRFGHISPPPEESLDSVQFSFFSPITQMQRDTRIDNVRHLFGFIERLHQLGIHATDTMHLQELYKQLAGLYGAENIVPSTFATTEASHG